MTRAGRLVGDRKPHILFRNGLYRCYSLIWGVGGCTTGIRLGLGHTYEGAYVRWMDNPWGRSGATLYTAKL